MISKWKCNYTDEEKGMALTILNKNQEISKLVDELEEQERHIKEADFEIERLNSIIKEIREYIKENTSSYYTNIEETNEEFELICDPEELLEILDKVDKENKNE